MEFPFEEEVALFDGEFPDLQQNDVFPSVKTLTEKDYSLNSPIIIDDIEFVVNPGNPLLNLSLKNKPFVKCCKEIGLDIKSTDSLYQDLWAKIIISNQWVHRVNSTRLTNIPHFREISESNLEFRVTSTFLKSLFPAGSEDMSIRLGQFHNNLSDLQVQTWIMKEEVFKGLVALMNSGQDWDGTWSALVSRGYPLKLVAKGKCVNQILWGSLEIHLGSEFLYFPSLDLSLNQCLSLMVKDIFLSRRNTTLFMGVNGITSPNILPTLDTIYRLGDDLIACLGDQAYEGLKLIEAICSERMAQLAEEGRDIPAVTDFGSFLEAQVMELADRGINIRELLTIILKQDNPQDLANIYGVYRHWGHPIIHWRDGLKALKEQVSMKKSVDSEYVNRLASNLARKLIRFHFNKTQTWPVSELESGHPLHKCVQNQTWPSAKVCKSFGDKWHTLPMTQIFKIPKSIPLASVLDDKAISLDREQLREALRTGSIGDTKERRLLFKYLMNDHINPMEFLKDINDSGLLKKDLVIGLREKEREQKRKGRFFALMTFPLRLYFVITEMLIAENFLPLFPSITMKDNLNKMYKKMIKTVAGHGSGYPSTTTYAYHIDYEKWNNHQRHESTYPIFHVMDKALGFQHLIGRTHEFFQGSLIYHASSPHLFTIDENLEGRNLRDDVEVCWNGQDGGLEGLRQKGWSIVSLLMIDDVSRTGRNTSVSILAQGDNQLICPSYKMVHTTRGAARDWELNRVKDNAIRLISDILEGALKLGLIIKKVETWASSNLLIYGKNILFNRRLLCSEPKRLARAGCLNNDQLPSLKNCLSTASTMALTIAQQSETIIGPVICYIILGREIIRDCLSLNLILGKKVNIVMSPMMKGLILLLDSSLGGIGGMNLNRMLIRQFPDPVTEGLSFWKICHDNSFDGDVKKMSLTAGCVRLKSFGGLDLAKLIEAPDSLNLHKEPEVQHIIKTKIQVEMVSKSEEYKNELVKAILQTPLDQKESFLDHLNSITPLFPRFLSELYSSSPYGFTESIIGLFQNSRTLKNAFKHKFTAELRTLAEKSELNGLKRISKRSALADIWDCSSSYADELRLLGWGRAVFGSTVPHPSEYLREMPSPNPGHYITVLRQGDDWYNPKKAGAGQPYLGSATSSQTRLYKSWESDTEYDLLRRPLSLQQAVGWFVEEGSSIAQTLKNCVSCYTSSNTEGLFQNMPKRTGSALHRFNSSRSSNGGYCATSHNLPAYLFVTTDTLSEITSDGRNWDFMFQPSILFAQLVSQHSSANFQVKKFGWCCNLCLREINEITLSTTQAAWVFPDLQSIESVYSNYPIRDARFLSATLTPEDPETISIEDLSFSCGVLQGYFASSKTEVGEELFPNNIVNKLHLNSHLDGLYVGIWCSTLVHMCGKQDEAKSFMKPTLIGGSLCLCTSRFSSSPGPVSLCRPGPYLENLMMKSRMLPASYPMKEEHMTSMVTHALNSYFRMSNPWSVRSIVTRYSLVVFSESLYAPFLGALAALNSGCESLKNGATPDRQSLKRLILDSLNPLQSVTSRGFSTLTIFQKIVYVDSEVRHCFKSRPDQLISVIPEKTEPPYNFGLKAICLSGESRPHPRMKLEIPQISCPLMSGRRVIQKRTGAHYKFLSMFRLIHEPRYALIAGDGSGGASATALRLFKKTKVVFNSLLDISSVSNKGVKPGGPSAILSLSPDMRSRCLNLDTCWEKPSDLTKKETWDYLLSIRKPQLVVCDAQVTTIPENNTILNLCLRGLSQTDSSPILLWKCYLSMMNDPSYTVPDMIYQHYEKVYALVPKSAGSFTSEVYLLAFVMKGTPSLDLKVSDLSLSYIIDVLPACASPGTELNRALDFDLKKAIQGFDVTLELHAWGLFTSLSSLLISDLCDIVSVRQLIESECHTVDDVLWIGYTILLFSLKSTCKVRADVESFEIPSLEQAQHLLSLVLGLEEYGILKTRHYSGWDSHVKSLQRRWKIYIGEKLVEISSSTLQEKNLSFTVPELSSKAAGWIRFFSILEVSCENPCTSYQSFNKLAWNFIKKNIGSSNFNYVSSHVITKGLCWVSNIFSGVSSKGPPTLLPKTTAPDLVDGISHIISDPLEDDF